MKRAMDRTVGAALRGRPSVDMDGAQIRTRPIHESE